MSQNEILLMKQSIGVAILTLNAKHHLSRCLPPYIHSPLKPRVVVVDSSSTDGTAEEAIRLGAEVLPIPREEFNHGLTRERARRHLNTDVVVMATPDAYATNEETLTHLVSPILEKKASIAYARQLPHDGADFFEAFPREFNYPSAGHIRSIEDIDLYGVYTFFCSDSCAAYSNKALDEIGGFQPVLLGEDTIATAMLLRRNHRIAYVAEAAVKHSHRYTLWQEFCRYFDTGIARKNFEHLLSCNSSDQQRGKAYTFEMLKRLAKEKPLLVPYGLFHTLVKLMGYRIGRASINAPLWLKKRLSSQRYYWNSSTYLQQVK